MMEEFLVNIATAALILFGALGAAFLISAATWSYGLSLLVAPVWIGAAMTVAAKLGRTKP
jgi:hypothetical protein